MYIHELSIEPLCLEIWCQKSNTTHISVDVVACSISLMAVCISAGFGRFAGFLDIDTSGTCSMVAVPRLYIGIKKIKVKITIYIKWNTKCLKLIQSITHNHFGPKSELKSWITWAVLLLQEIN